MEMPEGAKGMTSWCTERQCIYHRDALEYHGDATAVHWGAMGIPWGCTGVPWGSHGIAPGVPVMGVPWALTVCGAMGMPWGRTGTSWGFHGEYWNAMGCHVGALGAVKMP